MQGRAIDEGSGDPGDPDFEPSVLSKLRGEGAPEAKDDDVQEDIILYKRGERAAGLPMQLSSLVTQDLHYATVQTRSHHIPPLALARIELNHSAILKQRDVAMPQDAAHAMHMLLLFVQFLIAREAQAPRTADASQQAAVLCSCQSSLTTPSKHWRSTTLHIPR